MERKRRAELGVTGKVAFVFPGQGAQYVGMGKELAMAFPIVSDTLKAADEALGEQLSQRLFQGPEELLRQTYYTQPAIVAMSVAVARLTMQFIQPFCVAGHSLGEYSALVVAGSLSLEDALCVVRERARLMEEAVPPGTGTMAAVIGIEPQKVQEICDLAGGRGIVEPATFNGGGQVVMSGTVAGVEAATRLALEAGARRVQPLRVSGPFHSSLLQSAGERLRDVLDQVELKPCRIPVYCNVHADRVETPEEIREALVAQVSSPVRWEETVLTMGCDGVDTFLELGPRRILSGLVRRIDSKAQVLNIEDSESWSRFVAWAKGNGVI